MVQDNTLDYYAEEDESDPNLDFQQQLQHELGARQQIQMMNANQQQI